MTDFDTDFEPSSARFELQGLDLSLQGSQVEPHEIPEGALRCQSVSESTSVEPREVPESLLECQSAPESAPVGPREVPEAPLRAT